VPGLLDYKNKSWRQTMQEQLNEYVNQVILALLGLIVVLIKVWLDGLRKKAEAYLEAKTSEEQRKVIAALAEEAYAFAEAFAKQLDGPGKLNHAIDFLVRKAAKYGITVNSEDARAAIERAWLSDKRKELTVLAPVEYESPGGTN
jgi:hypothetical protein